MKISDRLPLRMLELLVILPLASPYMYTGFQAYGLLYSIDFWATPIILFLFCTFFTTVIHFLFPEILLLFSRRLRGGATRRLLITWIGLALFFEVLMVIVQWANYFDGAPPPDACLLCHMWDAKMSHTQ